MRLFLLGRIQHGHVGVVLAVLLDGKVLFLVFF